jgi:hypothetical protein
MKILQSNYIIVLLLLLLHLAATTTISFAFAPSTCQCQYQHQNHERNTEQYFGWTRNSILLYSTPAENDDENDISSTHSIASIDDNEKESFLQIEMDRRKTATAKTPLSPLIDTRKPSFELTASEIMIALGTNPRRILLSTLSAAGIALAGNFLGITSKLLTTIPEDQVEAAGIDTYLPRGGFKRCRTREYTFVIPSEWVADTFVELAKAERKIQPLDYSMSKRRNGGITTLPDSAYGPASRLNEKGVSESGDTNVSVIVSSGFSGFTLRGTLGTPTNAAETLLTRSIAPEGSGRVATLLDAEQVDGEKYKFEYIVDRGERGPPLRNISVMAASSLGDKLYTLTVVAPAEKWKDTKVDTKLRKIADSFHLR